MGTFWQYFLDFFGLEWAFHRAVGQPVPVGRSRAAAVGRGRGR